MHGRTQRRNGSGRQGRRTSILIEDFTRQTAPLQVDREAGVIRNVKVLGLHSENNRVYTQEACRKALRMYEGVRLNIDHPTDANGNPKPMRGRSSYDRLGKLVNVRFVEGDGIRADLEYLKAHRMADCVTEACERMPEAFGLSHNAQGEGDEKGGVFYVEEITEVRSVDLVAEPATTKSLLESKGRKPMANRITRELREDDVMDPGMGGGPAEGDGSHEDDLFAAFKKLRETDPEKANKILAMLKAEMASAGADEEEVPEMDDEEKKKKDDEEEETPEARNSDGTGWNTEKERNAMYGRLRNDGEYSKSKAGNPESKQHRATARKQLQEQREAVCRLAGLDPDRGLMEGLMEMTEGSFLKHLEYLKGLGLRSSGRGTQPRSQAPGYRLNGQPAKVTDAKSFASAILE